LTASFGCDISKTRHPTPKIGLKEVKKKPLIFPFPKNKAHPDQAGFQHRFLAFAIDGNLVTSRNPYDLSAFCREIIAFLKGII
jgi:hypothetical protein